MELTDAQIDEAAAYAARQTMREGLAAEPTEDDGVAYTWTRSGMKVRAAAREFSASALSRAWEAASDEGQVVS